MLKKILDYVGLQYLWAKINTKIDQRIAKTMISHVLDNTNSNMVMGADQGPVILGLIEEINSDLDAKLGGIQIASLTVTSTYAVPGQSVSITNDAYTVTSNFDNALSVTFPIYTWGEYIVASGLLGVRTINITSAKFDYILTLHKNSIIYDHGYDPYNIALLGTYGAGYKFAKNTDHFYLYSKGSTLNWNGCAAGTGYIDVTNYDSVEVTYGESAANAPVSNLGLIMANSMQMSGYWWHTNYKSAAVANTTVVTDISSLTGEYRLGIQSCAMATPYSTTVYKIVLK